MSEFWPFTNNETLKLSTVHAMCNTTNEAIFCGVFENRPSKFVSIAISAILTLLNNGLLLGMIWYERYGSDYHRTLMNKLFASVCWTAIAHNNNTVLDIFGIFFGTRLPSLCYIQLYLKVTATSVFLLQYDAIIITKYILIFWLKNPGAVNDDFWCIFINCWVCFASFLYDASRFFLPGRVNFSYFICSGTSPESDLEMPKRGGSVVENFTVILYIVVMIRILIHKRGQLGVPSRHSAVSRFRVQDLVNLDKSTIAKASTNLIVVFCFACYIYLFAKTKTMNYLSYNLYPNYFIVYIHLLLWTPFIIFLACSLYYIRHKPLRETLLRELKEYLRIN